MKNRNCLQILVKSMIAAALLVESAFADVNGHLLVESSGIKAVDRQLDVSLTESEQVRIAWDADLLGQARLQFSDIYADWAEVPNVRSLFITGDPRIKRPRGLPTIGSPIIQEKILQVNHKVNTYFRVVCDLGGGTRNTPPDDFGNKRIYGDADGDGVNDRGVFGTDDEPGPDVLWVDKDGDGLVDEGELTAIDAGNDTLKAVISNLKTVDGGSVPVPLEWLDDVLDGFEVAAGNDQHWVIADAVRIEQIGGIGGEGGKVSEKDWIQIVKLQYEGGLAAESVPLPLEWLKDILDDLAGSAGGG